MNNNILLNKPGELWLDTEGKPIQAHGGGMLYFNGTYYWYGENKDGTSWLPECNIEWDGYRVEAIGINCYSSKDLINWKNEGNVLPSVKDDPSNDLHTSKVIERPKVIVNQKTKKFIMWMHIDSMDYQYARAGVAVSDSPTGPFLYFGSVRPNDSDSRDITVFQDDDGRTYLIYSSAWNSELHICLLSVPESPRWLVMKSKENSALKVLQKVVDEKDAESELLEIHNSLSNHVKSSYSELLRGKMIRIMIIAVALGLCQQMSGVNAVFSYAPMIFEKSGAGIQAAFMSAVFVGVVNLLFTILAVWLMDKIGRRPLLITGALGMTLSHFTLMITAYFNNFEGIIVLIAILLFIASFATSVGPGYWILVSEILPNRLRGLAISIIQGLTSLASMVVVLLFPWELKVLGMTGTFFIYGLVTGLTILLVYYFIPETKGKSLEEIEKKIIK